MIVSSCCAIATEAQCASMASKSICEDCLQVAYKNIKGCLPSSEGRAMDVGCFIRYSGKAFFSTNNTVDLAMYLGSRHKREKKTAIIVGQEKELLKKQSDRDI